VEVTDNGVGISQVGIFVHGNHGLVAGNKTFAGSVFIGIRIEGHGNRVRHNQVVNGAESGIFVAGNNNVVEHNKITEAAVGILKAAGSFGNLIRFNQVFDTLVAVQDPASPGLARVVLPER
jgi:parallel beta-helix repeat protein